MDREILAELAHALASDHPNALSHIESLQSNEAFHDMCCEYEECSRSLEYWKHLGNQNHIREYEELLNDLLREVLQFLEEHQD